MKDMVVGVVCLRNGFGIQKDEGTAIVFMLWGTKKEKEALFQYTPGKRNREEA